MKKHVLLVLTLFSFHMAHAQFEKLTKAAVKAKEKVLGDQELGQDEIAIGLKEALDNGVASAVDVLSVKNGYFKSPYKILLPEQALSITRRLSSVPGFSNLESDLTLRMNRAAEDAATQAKPIFLKAIKGMSFTDAMNILMGENDAATKYLEKTCGEELYKTFLPIIQQALDKVKARELWSGAVSAYNKLPGVQTMNPNLDDHVNRRALAGLFQLIAQKELGIRTNVNMRTSDLLKKVFAKQDNRRR